MPSYNVTAASLTADVATLTLTSVSGLKAGLSATTQGVGHPYDGTHALTDVTTTDNGDGTYTYTVEYAKNHANIAEADVAGELVVPVTWATADDVYGFLGLLPSEPLDENWLTLATEAGNDWCYDRRQAAGYDDLIEAAPSMKVKLGTVMKCAEMYRQRGSFGNYQQFADLDVNSPINSNLEIMRMLGINRPAIA